MSSDDLPSIWLTLGSIFGMCLTHYFIPVLHYYLIGVFQKKRHRTEERINLATIDVENQYKVTEEESKEILKSERSVSRVLSMHFTFWTYAWITYFAVTSDMTNEQITEGTRFMFDIMGYIHLPAFILFLWIEIVFSWEFDYLSTVLEEKSCKTYIQELKEQQPVVTLETGAYHYETRYRTYTYTGANGQIMTGSESYQEQVQDYIETVQFPFTHWEDCSPNPNTLDLNSDKVTRVKLLKLVLFGDVETMDAFSRLRSEQEDKVKKICPDSHVYSEQGDDIPLFLDRFCAYWGTNSRKFWVNKRFYVILSLLLLTWFYRIAFKFATQTTCFRIVKKVYISEQKEQSAIN